MFYLFALAVLLAAPLNALCQSVSDVVRYGNLSIFYLKSDSQSDRDLITLDSAIKSGEVEIQENGTHTPLVRNLAHHWVFVPSATLLKGGQQDRMIAFDNVLEPKAPGERTKVFCIEKDRSSRRGSEPLQVFSKAEDLAPSAALRLAAKRSLFFDLPQRLPVAGESVTAPDMVEVTPGMKATLELITSSESENPAQQHIWRTIDTVLGAMSLIAGGSVRDTLSPSSLQLAIEKLDVPLPPALAIEPSLDSHITGLAYSIDGKLVGADRYCNSSLFRQALPALLKSIYLEALQKRGAGADLTEPAAVEAFLRSFNTAPRATHEISYSSNTLTAESPQGYLFETITTDSPSIPVHSSYFAK